MTSLDIIVTSAAPRSAHGSFSPLGLIPFLRVVKDQDPIVLVFLRRRLELALALVSILADLKPLPGARIVPAGLHFLAGDLVHVNADGAADRQVHDGEATVFGSGRLDALD